ncbi:MAG TPA: hypothetical protein VND64_10850 [Pirellulales bacterium]|nr:hypothetical protein [Pirellulales bacterium]
MKELIRKYRELLVKQESLTSVDQAIALVQQVFGQRIVARNGTFEFQSTVSRSPKIAANVQQVTCLVKQFDFALLSQLVADAAHKGKSEVRLRRRTMETAITLGIVPVLALHRDGEMPPERFSLLFDACNVLFHHAYFALLPELEGTQWQEERQLVLSAFHEFAESAPQVADRCSLLAFYYEAIGDDRRAGDLRLQALRATPADAEVFMTQLQTYWSFLVEHKLLSEAIDLLLESYPRVPRRDLDELHELIKLTFDIQAHHYKSLLVGQRS